MAWLGGGRRLHRRYERKAEHFMAFTAIACTLIRYADSPNETTPKRAFCPGGVVWWRFTGTS